MLGLRETFTLGFMCPIVCSLYISPLENEQINSAFLDGEELFYSAFYRW